MVERELKLEIYYFPLWGISFKQTIYHNKKILSFWGRGFFVSECVADYFTTTSSELLSSSWYFIKPPPLEQYLHRMAVISTISPSAGMGSKANLE